MPDTSGAARELRGPPAGPCSRRHRPRGIVAAATGEPAADAFPGCRVSRGEQSGHGGRAGAIDDVETAGAAHGALAEQVDLEPLVERIDSAPVELQEEVGLAETHLLLRRGIGAVELGENLLPQ